MNKVVGEDTYVLKKPAKGTGCKECAAYHELKLSFYSGADIGETLCTKLGSECHDRVPNWVWVLSPNA